MPTNYMRQRKVLEKYVPVTPATLWSWVKQGKFPQPIQLNPGQLNGPVVWSEDEILAWMSSRPRGYGPAHRSVNEARRPKAMIRRGGPTTPSGFVRRAP